MNTIREIEKINQEELDRGIAGTSASWHSQYLKAAWVYVGNLAHALTEGDVLCVMSQYGEIEDVHLVREEETGKSCGFAFVKYEDSKSCVLAVDNFVGVKLCERPMRVDHVENYRLPKNLLEQEEANEARNLGAGHAYEDVELSNQYSINQGQDLFAPVPQDNDDGDEKEGASESRYVEKCKRKEERKQKRQEKEGKRRRKEEKRDDHKRRKRSRRSGRDERDEDGGSSVGRREKNSKRHEKKDKKHRGDQPASSDADRS